MYQVGKTFWQSVFSLYFWCEESPLFLNLYDLHCAVPLPLVYLYTHTCTQQHTNNAHLRSWQQYYACFLRPPKHPANVELHSVLQPCDSALIHHHYGFLYRQPTVLPLQSFLHFQKHLKHILQRQYSLGTFPCQYKNKWEGTSSYFGKWQRLKRNQVNRYPCLKKLFNLFHLKK